MNEQEKQQTTEVESAKSGMKILFRCALIAIVVIS